MHGAWILYLVLLAIGCAHLTQISPKVTCSTLLTTCLRKNVTCDVERSFFMVN